MATKQQKYKFVHESARHILEAIQIYECARNDDAGVNNEEVRRAIRNAYEKIVAQLQKIRQ